MSALSQKPSREILRWLELILAERFGHVFMLEMANDCVRLTCADAVGSILVDSMMGMFSRADSSLPCAIWDANSEGWHSPLPEALPAPGIENLVVPLVERKGMDHHIYYDILGLVYWILSRQEEVGRTDLDEHGRFPAVSSHALKFGYLERPIVDEWLIILGQVIERQWPTLKLKHHSFSMKVSHDVDEPSRYGFRTVKGVVRAMLGDMGKHFNLKGALFGPWIRFNSKHALHPRDPANTFDWIMDMSEQRGLISAFYFICGRTDASKDADYEVGHPAIRTLMGQIYSRGHEIGLHPSYGTYRTLELIKREADRLRMVCSEEGIYQNGWGGRMHYLRWQQPITLQAWDHANMSYDSTLCYADRPGFRCGTAFEYPAFDPVVGRALSLRIRPLIAMECTVMDSDYMGLGTGESALNKFLQLKRNCEIVGGCFTLLWHNSRLRTESEQRLYLAILDG